MTQIYKIRMPVFIAGAVLAAGLILLMGQRFNYAIFLPSSYRVINIPLCFWIFYMTYLILAYKMFAAPAWPSTGYIKECVLLGFFVNLYVLLGNLVSALIDDRGQLSALYVVYIKSVFLVFTMAILYVAVKRIFIRKYDDPAKVLLYFPLAVVPIFLAIQNALLGHGGFLAMMTLSIIAGIGLTYIKISGFLLKAKSFFSKDRNIVVALFFLALIVRLIFGIILVDKTTQGPNGYNGFTFASDDGMTYDATAIKIMNDPTVLKKGEVIIWGHWDEMYSIFLSMLYRIFGRNFYIVVSVQAVFGALIPAVIFLIARMLFSRTVGIIAGTALSLKGGLIMLCSYMGHEAVWLSVLYLAIYMLTHYYKTNGDIGISWDIAIGLALGVLAIFRSIYLYFVPFVLMWETLFFKKIRMIRKAIHVIIIIAVFSLVIMSVMGIYHNRMSLFNENKAQIIWYNSRPVPPFHNLGNERLDPLGINLLRDPKGSLVIIAKHPVEFFKLAAQLYPLRIIGYLETYQFGFFDPIYMINPANMKNEFAPTLEFYFTVFFLAGIVLCFRKVGILSSPVYLLLAFHILLFAIILFQPSPRIKEISSPAIYLIGSYGAYMIFRSLTETEQGEKRRK